MPAAAAIAGSAIVGAISSSDSSRRQANTARDAAAMQQAQYEQTREDQTQWREAGKVALGDIASQKDYWGHQFDKGDLQKGLAPNYDWQLAQGLGNARNAANVGGGMLSGNTLAGLNRYAQDYAGNAYQQAFTNYNDQRSGIYNRLASLAGLGQQATQATSNAGADAAARQGSLMAYGAKEAAAGNVGAANFLRGGVNDYLGYKTNYDQTRGLTGLQILN